MYTFHFVTHYTLRERLSDHSFTKYSIEEYEKLFFLNKDSNLIERRQFRTLKAAVKSRYQLYTPAVDAVQSITATFHCRLLVIHCSNFGLTGNICYLSTPGRVFKVSFSPCRGAA
jgi:hypothetical protein